MEQRIYAGGAGVAKAAGVWKLYFVAEVGARTPSERCQMLTFSPGGGPCLHQAAGIDSSSLPVTMQKQEEKIELRSESVKRIVKFPPRFFLFWMNFGF